MEVEVEVKEGNFQQGKAERRQWEHRRLLIWVQITLLSAGRMGNGKERMSDEREKEIWW